VKQFVVYKRVSTQEQGRSGLGLAAQDRDLGIYLEAYAEDPFEVLATFTDVQTGSDDNRPELAKALEMARRTGAEVLVAKLDRLSRKVSFIAGLLDDKKLRLRVATMPNADKFQLHIYAALAEQEREFISLRTKAALAEAKAKGVRLGGLRDKTNRRNATLKQQARVRAEKVANLIIPLRDSGNSYQAIADALNDAGVTTARDATWHASQVKRTIERLSCGHRTGCAIG
jgi:DNA invertase Pin-like site-specific DNA recombinase